MRDKFNVGDTVDYRSWVNGPITSRNHIIRKISLEPNMFGCAVAWLDRKPACVSLNSLSLYKEESNAKE